MQKKHLKKFNTLSWLKTFSKQGIEGNFLNLIKIIYKKPTANIILNDEKVKNFPLKLGKRQECTLSPLLFNITLEILANSIRPKKKGIKYIQIGKEDIKLCFAYSMTICRKSERTNNNNKKTKTNKKFLELVSNYTKIAKYTLIYKFQLLFYVPNKNKWNLNLKTQCHLH